MRENIKQFGALHFTFGTRFFVVVVGMVLSNFIAPTNLPRGAPELMSGSGKNIPN